MSVLTLFLLVMWYLSGMASFVYWHTRDFDFKYDDLLVTFFVGITGPIAFLLGLVIFGNYDNKIIMKRRVRKNAK